MDTKEFKDKSGNIIRRISRKSLTSLFTKSCTVCGKETYHRVFTNLWCQVDGNSESTQAVCEECYQKSLERWNS